jgi:hypothetical protein
MLYSKPFRLLTILLVAIIFNGSASFLVSAESSLTNAPRVKSLRQGTSTNWAGYAVQTNLSAPQSGAVSDVKGSWVVPTLICTSTNTYASAWVGIDGYSSASVEQTGTEHECINGQPSYYAWYEMYPKRSFLISNITIHAGDLINAEVKYLGNNKFNLILTDVTTNQQFSTTQKGGNAKRQSAEWIVEAPYSGGVLPLANFGTTTITNATATLNAHVGAINDLSWQNDRIDMGSSTTIKAQTSSLTPDGKSFDVVWQGN